MRKVNRLARVALIVTGIVGLFWFIVSGVGLALVKGVGDVVMWEIPFTGRSVRLPDWTWPVFVVGTLVSIPILTVLWSVVAVKSWKRRRR